MTKCPTCLLRQSPGRATSTGHSFPNQVLTKQCLESSTRPAATGRVRDHTPRRSQRGEGVYEVPVRHRALLLPVPVAHLHTAAGANEQHARGCCRKAILLRSEESRCSAHAAPRRRTQRL
jgi:hypothetical protein